MSLTIQSAAPPAVPAFEITKRPILYTSVWGRPVICADCVGRIGTPVDIGKMSRLACVGRGASTTAARGGNGKAASSAPPPTHPYADGGHPGEGAPASGPAAGTGIG